ncbi:MAG: glycosyltransferase [Candidatus Goldiibacteriota bacterium]
MKKKNIAIVITKLELGGAQITALETAKRMDKEKFNVHLISGGGGYLDSQAMGIEGISFVLMEDLKHPVSPVYDFKAMIKLKNYFMKNQIDVVHTHSSKAGFIGRIAAKKAKVKKIIHTVHGFPFHEFQNPVLHYCYVLAERYAAGFTHVLAAVGRDVKEYGLLNKTGKEGQYEIIRAGIDIKKTEEAGSDRRNFLLQHGLEPGVFTVGMIGNFKKQKNPLEFAEIAEEAISKNSGIQFIFAGDGPLREKTEKKLKEYGIASKVKITGWIDNPEEMIKSLDVFLLTSRWEGLPCTLAQAAAARVPCIASDIRGNREIIRELNMGELYKPGDIKAAAAAIVLFKNMGRKPAEEYSEKAKDFLKEFDISHMVKQYEDVYARQG